MEQLANKNLISRSASSALRIIFEMLVLFHHLYIVSTILFEQIRNLVGPIAVGGFFVLSGYGVGVNFKKKGQEYCSKLLKKRVPSIYSMILIADVFYLFLYYYLGNSFDNAFDLIVSVLYIPLFSGYVALSHYIYFLADLLVYYFIFLALAYVFRNHEKKMILTTACMFAILLVVIIILSIINSNTGSSRYLRACLCFPIGLLIACFDEIICEFLDDYKWLVVSALFVSGFACCVTFKAELVLEYITPIFMSLAVIFAVYGASSKRKSLNYLENLVLYVYVSHEFIRELLNKELAGKHANFRGLLAIVLSIIVAIIIHTVVEFVNKKRKAKALEEKPLLVEVQTEEKVESIDAN